MRSINFSRMMGAALVLGLAVIFTGCEKRAIMVTIEPEAAVAVGAQWRIGGEEIWQPSGAIVEDVVRGTHIIEFRAAPEWDAPENAVLIADRRRLFVHEAVYTPRALGAPAYVEAVSGPMDVLIEWEPQTRYTVAGYHLYKTEEGAKEAVRLTDAPLRALRYEDDDVLPGRQYAYYVTTVARDGTESDASQEARVIAGQVTLDLPFVSGLPGNVVRMPIGTRNVFGLSSETLRMDVAFYDCETGAPVDVFVPDSVDAIATAITANMRMDATSIAPGVVRISAVGTDAPALTGEGRVLVLEGVLADDLTMGAVICAKVAEAELWLGDARLGYAATAGALVVTDECMRGDVDNNQLVETEDADLVLRIAARHEDANDCRWRAGDLNVDSRLNTADATVILRLLVGWYDDPQRDDAPTLAEILEPRDTTQPPAPITVSVGDAAVNAGDTVELPVNVSMPEGLYGAEVTVAWPDDPELLEPLEFGPESSFDAAAALIDVSQPGVARILISRHTAMPSPGALVTLARLRFRMGVRAPQGYAPPVTLQGANLFGAYGESADWHAPIVWEDGVITFDPDVQPEGEDEPVEGEEETEGEEHGPEEGEPEEGEGETNEGEEEEPFTYTHEVNAGEKILVAAGDFEMGRPYEWDADWGEERTDELPVHSVTLDAYQIGRYSVTNQEYADVLNWALAQTLLTDAAGTAYMGGVIYAYGQAIADTADSSEQSQIMFEDGSFSVRARMGYNNYVFPMADHPVVRVSWYGAAAYCNWLSEMEGLEPRYDTDTWERYDGNGYCLPTEAQWERAAAWDPAENRHWRYGMSSDTIDHTRANHGFANPLGLMGDPYTSPVGWYNGENPAQVGAPDVLTVSGASPAGAYDMSGNVFEWCHDWSYRVYSGEPVTNPSGAETSVYRVLRGGSTHYDTFFCRAAGRMDNPPDDRSSSVGFRIYQAL